MEHKAEHKFSKRTIVRIYCFALALAVILGAGWYSSHKKSESYRSQLEAGYMRAIDELAAYLENLHTDLTKSMYTGTPLQLSKLSSRVYQQTGLAKNALEQIPTSGVNLANTYKFLSQAGDYALALANRTAAGTPLTDEDRQSLKQLDQSCQSLKEQLYLLQDELLTGGMSFQKLERIARSVDDSQAVQAGSIGGGFQELEDSLAQGPALIYDGPFSDHILEREPRMTQDAPEVPREQALELASTVSGLPASQLRAENDEDGKMPSYAFSADNLSVSVTKNGGYLCYFLNSRQVGEARVGVEQALSNARAWLDALGVGPLAQTYYELSGQVVTINYAAQDGDITCYTDLIKVSVSLDEGEVTAYDARGYLTNHQQRDYPQSALTADEAKAVLSPLLTPEAPRLALIPTAGLGEQLCYEFRCTAEDGQPVLVYINVETGEEAQILLLLISENGTLTV